jgi:hypothetical protein
MLPGVALKSCQCVCRRPWYGKANLYLRCRSSVLEESYGQAAFDPQAAAGREQSTTGARRGAGGGVDVATSIVPAQGQTNAQKARRCATPDA